MSDWRGDLDGFERAAKRLNRAVEQMSKERAFHPENKMPPDVRARLLVCAAQLEELNAMLKAYQNEDQ